MACLLASELARAATIVACVGDSITAGAWPGDLGPLLGNSYTVKNYGVSGTTLLKKGDSPYWVTQQFTDSHTVNPNIVIIMLGTNDSKPQNWGTHSGEYAADYEALIDTYIALSSKPRIFLNLPPPAGTNSYGISGTIIENEILPLVRQTGTKKGTGLIDIFSAFGGHNFDATLFGSASDQVHPGDKGAQRIADTVFAALKAPADAGVSDAASSDAAPIRDAALGDAALGDAALSDAALMPDAASQPKDAAELRDVAAPIEAASGGTGGNTGTAGAGGATGASGGAGGATGASGGAGGASGGAGGATGASGGAGGGGSPAAAGSTGGGGASDPSRNPAADNSGCSCRVANVPSDRRLLWAVALIWGIAARRRRRRKHSHISPHL